MFSRGRDRVHWELMINFVLQVCIGPSVKYYPLVVGMTLLQVTVNV